jgi:2-polyprenyl-3-methyl-5-hydroxy-6-metoxy-1,4-benzoquinol methylase
MSLLNDDLTTYYAQRAAEYEAIYAKPERQADLKAAAGMLQDIFRGKTVLEIACGTGYWTQKIAETAANILATDINESVLEIARFEKHIHLIMCDFSQADLYDIQSKPLSESLFGGFIWSHIKLEELPHFLKATHALVQPGGLIVFMDNRYVEGSSTPISEHDLQGNTYQQRVLKDGTAYSVLKNFP